MRIDQNIELLKKNQRHWIGKIDEYQILYPKYIVSENKIVEYFKDKEGRILCLEDKYNEDNKINRFKKEVIFIFGINSIQEIKEIIRTKNKNSIILIVEPHFSFFQHALNHKNLDFFQNENVYLFADEQVENITEFLKNIILDINLIGLFKNIVVYLNNYYQNYDLEMIKKIIVLINQYIQSITMSIGNDVYDSIQGLNQNLNNLKYLSHSKNPNSLKNRFKNKPAVMVAAGPSLNKNIHFLKKYEKNIVIIAVDTIVERLLKEKIVPDFICSVERIKEVWEYFYKDKNIPKEVTLVAPLVLDSRIFESYQGEYVIPFRTEVTEFRWLQSMLEISEDVSVPVGLSCAHMAFGIAQHLGCEPIIMIGQDLAYDSLTGNTHVSGTTYDQKENSINHTEDEIVTGYYDGYVKTTKIWNTFRHWFESQILNENINVINATEGGAKIFHTQQLPLEQALKNYAKEPVENVSKVIKASNEYDFDVSKAIANFKQDLVYIKNLKERCKNFFNTIKNININHDTFSKKKFKFNTELEKVHVLINEAFKHELVMHNTQPLIVTFLWEFNSVEDILSLENLKKKRGILGRFIAALTVTIEEIEKTLENGIIQLEKDGRNINEK